MAIENFGEITTYFQDNKDAEDVKGFLGGLSNLDVFKGKLTNDADFKSYFDSESDKRGSKSLQTWKDNNLDGLVSAKVKELYPDADPKDLKIKELEDRFNNAEKGRLKETLTNKSLKFAQDQKLPTDLIDFFIGNDDETTTKNLEKFMATMALHDEAIKTEFARGNSYTPPNGDKSNLGAEDKMRAEIAKFMK